jgi:hypothetical protein
VEDNTKTELEETGLCGVEWQYLSQDTNFWFHNSEELLEQMSDYLRRAALHTVTC